MKPACKATLALLTLLVGAGAATGQSQKWKFLAYGDTRGTGSSDQINTKILTELVRQTTNTVPKPAFVLVPGDLVYSGNMQTLAGWTNIMSPVYAAGIGVYPVRGNHDDDSDPNAYKNMFGSAVPANGPAGELGLTYALFHSNVLVLAMDNYVTPHQVNTNWIKAVLNTNMCLHVFAMGHEPAFSVNHADCLDDVPVVRNAFWNILSNAACRAYFCGHDHFYDHMRLNDQDGDPSDDVHQYIVGGGGAPFHADSAYDGTNGIWTPTRVLHEMTNGYVAVEIDGPVATLTYYHRTAANTYVATSDVFTYSLAPVIAASYTNGALTLAWSGGGILQSAPEAGGSWTTLDPGKSPFVITNFSSPKAFYRVQLRPRTF